MNKFLYVIGGAPRSRTTFLMRCLLAHSKIKGCADPHPKHTNEPPQVMHAAIAAKNYSGLSKLWDYWCAEEGNALVIKAPGYIHARQFFEDNPLGLTPIFLQTARPIDELIVSNALYPDGRAHLSRPLIMTDCPEDSRINIEGIWPGLDLYERSYLRCAWHTAYEKSYGGSMVAPGDYRRAAALAKRLCGLAGLEMEPTMTSFIKTFSVEKFDAEELAKANDAMVSVTRKLGAA